MLPPAATPTRRTRWVTKRSGGWQSPRVVAVGEIGLDFYRDLSPRERQVEVLRLQLETAAEVGKPVAVHCREAHQRLLPLLEEWSRRLGGRLSEGRPLGVLHYFSGDTGLAKC